MGSYREGVRGLIDYINRELIGEVPRNLYTPEIDLKRAITESGEIETIEHVVPITTTLLVLNSCLGKNTLIEGGSGSGKTKLASVVGSLLFQMPYEVFERRRITGVPGVTINEIYATHDLAELTRGNDVAFLYLPFYFPFLIIDELNRYSEIEQNRIREGIATGVWNYANHYWKVGKQVVVSAINPESYGGTFILNENLLDNYSVVLEPPYYNPLFHRELVRAAEGRIKERLGLEDEVDALMKFYSENKNKPDMIVRRIKELQEKTSEEFEKRKIPLVKNGFIEEIQGEVEEIRITAEGLLFFESVLAEMTYSDAYGRVRLDDPMSDSAHDKPYLAGIIEESLAGRFLKDWIDCSKAIAWYFGKEEAGTDEIRASFVYTAPRRLKPVEELFQEAQNQRRALPVRFEVARRIIERAWGSYSGFKEAAGFDKIRRSVRILNGEEQGNLEDAIRMLKLADHPLAKNVLEAVSLHRYYSTRKEG